jgi:uncharacterized membrane protein
MWFLFAAGSLVLTAFEEAIDKIVVVSDKAMDTLAATVWRNFIWGLWIGVFGLLGFFGTISVSVSLFMVLIGVLWTGSGIFYTYLLKRIEVTSEAAISYIAPFLYLVIDVFLVHLHLTTPEVLGILLLITGGLMFVIVPGHFRLRKEFTPVVWGIFLYDFALGIIEYYGFKYYFHGQGMNEPSFYFSLWIIMMIAFLPPLFIRKAHKALWHVARERNYLRNITVSKGFDALASLLWLHAMTIAAISQVEATSAFYPIILLGTVFVLQQELGYKAEEEFAGTRLWFKIGGVALLAVGGFLAQ